MENNILITNTRVVTPLGRTAKKGRAMAQLTTIDNAYPDHRRKDR